METDDFKRNLMALYKFHRSIARIAEAMGIDRQALGLRMKAHGLTLKDIKDAIMAEEADKARDEMARPL